MIYCQRNYTDILGNGPDTIATAGCLLTTGANLLTWAGDVIDPPALDNECRDKGIFWDSELLTLDWLSRVRPDEWAVESSWNSFSDPAPLDACDTSNPAVYIQIGINFPHGTINDGPHFVAGWHYKSGDPETMLLVADPWTGSVRSLSDYGWPSTIITSIVRLRWKGVVNTVKTTSPVQFNLPLASPMTIGKMPNQEVKEMLQVIHKDDPVNKDSVIFPGAYNGPLAAGMRQTFLAVACDSQDGPGVEVDVYAQGPSGNVGGARRFQVPASRDTVDVAVDWIKGIFDLTVKVVPSGSDPGAPAIPALQRVVVSVKFEDTPA